MDGANHVLKVEEGFLILGYTTSFGNGGKDLWIIKQIIAEIRYGTNFMEGCILIMELKLLKRMVQATLY